MNFEQISNNDRISKMIDKLSGDKLAELKRDRYIFLNNGERLEIEEACISVPPNKICVFALVITEGKLRERSMIASSNNISDIYEIALDRIKDSIIERCFGFVLHPVYYHQMIHFNDPLAI